jgi:hypothetical protein
MSLRYIFDQRLMCFICKSVTVSNPACLLHKLILWYCHDDKHIKRIMSKYGIWRLDDLNLFKTVILNAFDDHCNELVL